MISGIKNNLNPSFTSVVPVRVFIDGMETFDEKLIKSSCRQLGNFITDPAKKQLQITKEFARYDRNFTYDTVASIKKPSDFIRCVIDTGRSFLFTGPQAKKLQETGKAVGAEKKACKIRKVSNSFDLMVAKKNYGLVIADLISTAKFRMTDACKKSNDWKPVTLNINMKSNGKYGLSTFKIKLDSINFNS